MAHAEIDDTGDIAIWSEYREKDLIKMVPGARWQPADAVWRVPLSWSSCKVLRGVFGDALTVGEQLAQWAWDEVNNRVNPCLKLRESLDAEFVPADIGERLYPYQRAGANFLATAVHALLADEMGTGKTIQVIAALEELRTLNWQVFPALVIAPNSVKINWQKEFTKWAPHVDVAVIKGSANVRRKILETPHDVYVVNWEAMRLHSRLAGYGSIRLTDDEKAPKELNRIPFKTVIADEAHKLKEPKSKQTRAVWYVGHQSTVRYRWALTGTPLANAPDDLWSILHFIDPHEWPAKTKYVDRYCLISWNAWGGMDVIGIRPDTHDEFFDVLDPRMRRMPKELVLPFLPPKTRVTRWAEMTAKQAKAYKSMYDEQIVLTVDDEGVSTGMVVATNNLTKNTRLSQFSSSYSEVNSANEVRLTFPSNKVDALLEILDDMNDNEPLVVAAESRQLIELTAKKLDELMLERQKKQKSPLPFSYRLLVGGMTEDQRQMAIDDFMSGKVRMLLFTIKAGGVGLTFTRAGTCVFLQRSWSMLDNKQAEDRVHRIGSEIHDKIVIIDIVAPDTIEEKQIERLHVKFQRLQEIVRDKQTMRELGDAHKLQELEAEESAILNSDLMED